MLCLACRFIFSPQPELQLHGVKGTYAHALFSAAARKNCLEAVEQDMLRIAVSCACACLRACGRCHAALCLDICSCLPDRVAQATCSISNSCGKQGVTHVSASSHCDTFYANEDYNPPLPSSWVWQWRKCHSVARPYWLAIFVDEHTGILGHSRHWDFFERSKESASSDCRFSWYWVETVVEGFGIFGVCLCFCAAESQADIHSWTVSS